MNKELQDLAWSVLPKEFLDAVRQKVEYYNNPVRSSRGYYRCLIYLFGLHNLTSDTEVLTTAVISGWVARDKGGFISLFSYLPDRVIKDDLGFWGRLDGSNEIDIPQDSFSSLTWNDDQMEVEITIKPKKKSSTK